MGNVGVLFQSYYFILNGQRLQSFTFREIQPILRSQQRTVTKIWGLRVRQVTSESYQVSYFGQISQILNFIFQMFWNLCILFFFLLTPFRTNHIFGNGKIYLLLHACKSNDNLDLFENMIKQFCKFSITLPIKMNSDYVIDILPGNFVFLQQF